MTLEWALTNLRDRKCTYDFGVPCKWVLTNFIGGRVIVAMNVIVGASEVHKKVKLKRTN